MSLGRKAVFLDRDGTLNVDKGYVHKIEDWEWIPGALNALVSLKNAGFLVVIVTNQAGIARGYYNALAMNRLHASINEELKLCGGGIDGFYYCPHHPDLSGACLCRKPHPGLIFEAGRDLGIDLGKSWLIGDKLIDCQAGKAAGVKPILVRTGYGNNDSLLLGESDICVPDCMAASQYIMRHI